MSKDPRVIALFENLSLPFDRSEEFVLLESKKLKEKYIEHKNSLGKDNKSFFLCEPLEQFIQIKLGEKIIMKIFPLYICYSDLNFKNLAETLSHPNKTMSQAEFIFFEYWDNYFKVGKARRIQTPEGEKIILVQNGWEISLYKGEIYKKRLVSQITNNRTFSQKKYRNNFHNTVDKNIEALLKNFPDKYFNYHKLLFDINWP